MSPHRRVVVRRSGGPEVLVLEEEPVPSPKRGQVRVRVEAIGVAYGDVMRRRGILAPPWAFTPGYDVVGRIDAVGPGVEADRVGQRVAVILPTIGFGAYAEHVCVGEPAAVPVPDGLDPVHAVGLGLNYVSAHQILHRRIGVSTGQTILVHGASGGVGTALVDLAVRAGLTVLGTASAAKHDLVRERGAVPIDYRSEDFVQRVHAEHPDGVDAVTDPLGGAHLHRSAAALRPGGTLVFFGVTGDLERGLWPLVAGLWHVFRLKLSPGLRVRSYGIGTPPTSTLSSVRQDHAAVLALGAEGLSPVIGATFPLDRVSDAHALLESGDARGKIVLTTGEHGAT